MLVSELIDRAVKLISLVSTKSPKRSVEADSVIEELKKLKGWAYPKLSTEDIQRVIRCKNCRYYKKYRKKGDHKAAPFFACSLYKMKRSPEDYCSEGKEAGHEANRENNEA